MKLLSEKHMTGTVCEPGKLAPDYMLKALSIATIACPVLNPHLENEGK
jgi:hypothetical protein